MKIEVPKGKHDINFYFTDTPIRIIGKMMSVLGIIITLYLLTASSIVYKKIGLLLACLYGKLAEL